MVFLSPLPPGLSKRLEVSGRFQKIPLPVVMAVECNGTSWRGFGPSVTEYQQREVLGDEHLASPLLSSPLLSSPLLSSPLLHLL